MNYKKQVRLFNIRKINAISMSMFIASLVLFAMINIFATDNIKNGYLVTPYVWLDIIIAVVILLVGLIVHEGLHALMAIIVGKNKPSDIKFGINIKQGILYCHAQKPLTKSAYLIVLITPIIVTAVIPIIISTIFSNAIFISAFAFLFAGGAGDLVMFFDVCKNVDKKAVIFDHEKSAGYYVAYKEGEEPEGFAESTEQDESKILGEMVRKNDEFSQKTSWIKIVAIVIFLIIIVLMLYILAQFMKII